ncbi:MAG: GntR family transcriptional regulator [Planctomycetota bacterium]
MTRILTKLNPGKPKYQIIRDALRDRIKAGELKPGSMLPAEVMLAEKYAVSRLTARRALEELAGDGLLKRYPGKGTFVQERNKPQGHLATGHFLFLFTDMSPDFDYNFAERLDAERYLAKRNIGLSVATLKSSDAARNHFTPFLSNGQIDGILLDGEVYDYHYEVLQRFDAPCLVVGNHFISSHIPQVRVVYADISERIARMAIELFKIPLWLVVQRFTLQATNEIYHGYKKACAAAGQPSLLEVDAGGEGEGVVESILARGERRFAIFTTDGHEQGILQDYEKHGLNYNDNPIIVFGNSTRISQRNLARITAIPAEKSGIAVRAAELLVEMIETGRSEVYEELQLDFDIEETLKSAVQV